MSALLGAVVAVIDSALGLLQVKKILEKVPLVAEHWGLGISILMVWVLNTHPAAKWGLLPNHEWLSILANGAIVYAAIPLKDAVVSMVNKGLRA
jgi:hypothetical protein